MRYIPILILLISGINMFAQPVVEKDRVTKYFPKNTPRLIWQSGDEDRVRDRIKKDPAAKAYYRYILEQADGMIDDPLLERVMTGRRLLDISRKALKRCTYLAFAWRMTGEEKYIDRLEGLLESVSGFSDWNPMHFLDTAEMSTAVAIALDWADEGLSPEVKRLAREALYEKGLMAGMHEKAQLTFYRDNNWNQVCNAGMVAAALVLMEKDPDTALFTINRMLEGIGNVLHAYAPDGVYPEGATYWSYGTQFNLLLVSMLETALGSDFGLPEAPGFMESADFIHQVTAPDGNYYNFFDCGISSSFNDSLLWFAMKTGNPRHVQKENMLRLPDREINSANSAFRIAPVSFLWYVHFSPEGGDALPLSWVGRGPNPVGVFRSSHDDPEALYLAFKGGRGAENHGNMDAGSFILNLDGVRWGVDMGNQSYHPLEEYYKVHGGSLWDGTQDSVRWELLTKNNFGHSTLTINDALHVNTGMATIESFDAKNRTATLDMAGPLGGEVFNATRTFMMPTNRSVEIIDAFRFLEIPQTVRWQMTTQADVTTVSGGAILRQDGKSLKLEILEPNGAQVSVVSLNPPPHEMDKIMPGLKRIDINVPGHLMSAEDTRIHVRLIGE